jgi:hypothetical protein
MNMDLVQKMGEQEMKISLVTEIKMTYEVKECQSDSYTMEVKLKETKITTGIPGMNNISLDSNTAEDLATQSDFSPIFKAVIDKPFEVVMTKTGKAKSVKGMEKLMDAMIGAFSEDVPEDVRQQITGQFGSQFSEEAFKAQLEQSAGYFPGKPVGIGDSWTSKITTNASNFAISIDMKSTLKSIEDNVANIDIDGTVSTPEGYEQDVNGIKAKVSLNGTYKGIFKINKDNGWVISSDLAMPLNGSIEVMGMKVPVYVASTIKVTDK